MMIIKRGDTFPSIKAWLQNAGVTVPTDAIESVVFNMRGPIVTAGVCPVFIAGGECYPQDGTWVYDWQPGDTDTAGAYEAEFVATFDSGQVGTFPNRGTITILIVDQVC